MGHIQVTTYDDGLLGIETLQIVLEIILPFHAVVKTAQFILRIGCIDGDEEEIRHLKGDDTAFMVVLVNTDAISDVLGLMAGEDGCSAIAFFLRIIPITLVAFKLKVELSFLHLCFLQTEEVGIQLTEGIAEALALTGTKTVNVPRY